MKILAFDWNSVLEDVLKELHIQGHEILPLIFGRGDKKGWEEADVIVVWQETELGAWKDWIKEVQAAGKRVILVQHGRRGTSRIFPPFNEELVSDQLCVWGQNDLDRMVSCGVPREKIYVTGTPVLKRVKPRVPHEGINVVFSPEHWDTDVMENLVVAGALRKMKGVKITTKLLAGEHNPHEYDNPIASERNKPGHLDICIEVLKTADAVVAVSESTFELLAQTMDIPVIIADIWVPKACAGDSRYKEYQREYSSACEKVKDMNKLGDVVMKHIKHPELLRAERKQIAIADGGFDIEDPVSEIIKVICDNSKA